jgi:transcriptional regulator with XRE-family HTH domain
MVSTYFAEKYSGTRLPLSFGLLQARLVASLRQRVRGGELTERGLARLAHVSQPHIHNVLNGKRMLSMGMADQILRELHIDLLDLVTIEELTAATHPRREGGVMSVLPGDGATPDKSDA